jgi:phosphoglycerol transferase
MSYTSHTDLLVILLIAGFYLFQKTNPSKGTIGVLFVKLFTLILLLAAYGVAYYFTDSNFTNFSVILLIAGLYLYRKTSPSKVTMGIFFILIFSSILLFIAYGVANYFTGNGIDEATVYHLEYGLEGAGFLEYSGLIVTAITVLIIITGCLIWLILKWKGDREPHAINSLSMYSFLSVSLLLNPASSDIFDLQENVLTATKKINAEESALFYQHYRKGGLIALQKSKKNIVFIYAESLERTYFDETVFPGLIKGLRELESNSTYFTNIKQVTGTGWTVGGMTASQCGIPLFTPSHGNSMSGMDQFLSSAVCLGDALNNNGYQMNYMGGASLDFAGKGKLYKSHGFKNVLGRAELVPKLENKTYRTGWGLYDDSLLIWFIAAMLNCQKLVINLASSRLHWIHITPMDILQKAVKVQNIRMHQTPFLTLLPVPII